MTHFLRVLLGLLLLAAPLRAAPLGDVLAQDGRFRAFSEGLSETGLLDRFAAEGGGTVLAPTDEAFRRMPEALIERLTRPEAAEALRAVLALHLIPSGPHPSDDLPVELRPLEGDMRIVTTYTRGALTFRAAPPEEAEAVIEATLGTRAVSEARVRTGDIRADSAVIHALDQVLLPYDLEARLDRLVPASPGQGEAAPDAGPTETVTVTPSAPERPDPTADRGEADVYVYDPAAQDQAEPEPTDRAEAGTVVVLPGAEVAAVDDAGPPADHAAQAAAPVSDAPATPAAAGETVEVPAIDLTSEVVSVADLLGQPVRDRAGETVGEVVDVLIDLEGAEARTLVYAPSGGLVDLSAIGLGDEETVRIDLAEIVIDPLDGAVILEEGAEDG